MSEEDLRIHTLSKLAEFCKQLGEKCPDQDVAATSRRLESEVLLHVGGATPEKEFDKELTVREMRFLIKNAAYFGREIPGL